jgi:hypothetical protein
MAELRLAPGFRGWAISLCATLLIAALAGVYGSAAEVEPLAVGTRVPPARVSSVKGDPVDLADLVREQGALLVFYRGGW